MVLLEYIWLDAYGTPRSKTKLLKRTNKWFNDLCRNIMLEDMDEDVVDALKENIKENKKELGDGKVEYS